MAHVRLYPFILFATILTVGCTSTKESALTRKITSEPWGKTAAGESVELYTLTNAKGAEARIATYGGTVVSLKVADRSGTVGDIRLGFDSRDDDLHHPPPP